MSELVQSNKSTDRIFVYDVIRFVAIAAVIMIHDSATFVIRFLPHDMRFLTGNIFDSLSHCAVPLFLMLSGVFMLDENRELPNKKLAYKIGKLIVLLIIWSTFYALIFHQKEFVYYLFYGHYHLWYLYVIIGLYLVTPVLRLFVKQENKKILYYLIILAVIFQFCPSFIDFCCHRTEYVSKFFDMFRIGIVSGYVAYYILGRLIVMDYDRIMKYKNVIYSLGLTAVITCIVGTEIYTTETVKAYNVFYAVGNIVLLLYSTAVFIFLTDIIKRCEHKISGFVKNAVTGISKLSFGIYLVHACILALLRVNVLKGIFSVTMNNTNVFLYIFIVYLLTFAISYLVVFIISKIKYLNQLVKI